MESFQSKVNIKDGIILLDYFVDPAETFKLSNSLDMSVIGMLKHTHRNTVLSTYSRRSSYSGSKHKSDLISNATWKNNRQKPKQISEEEEIAPDAKNFAQQYVANLFDKSEKLCMIQESDDREDEFSVKEYEYSEYKPMILEYLQSLYAVADNSPKLEDVSLRLPENTIKKPKPIDLNHENSKEDKLDHKIIQNIQQKSSNNSQKTESEKRLSVSNVNSE